MAEISALLCFREMSAHGTVHAVTMVAINEKCLDKIDSTNREKLVCSDALMHVIFFQNTRGTVIRHPLCTAVALARLPSCYHGTWDSLWVMDSMVKHMHRYMYVQLCMYNDILMV